MSTSAGTLTIDIAAGVARLQADMKEAKASVKDSMEGIDQAVDLAKKALLALGVALSVEALKEWIGRTMETIDATAKMADRLGMATESLTGIQLAAQLAGVSQETLNTGMRKMETTLYAAAQGVATASEAFETLHLNVQQLMAQSPDKQLGTIVDALGKVQNVTERNALAAQIFGGRASEMLNLVGEGSKGIREATDDTQAWGTALNRVDSAKVEMANDAITRAKSAFQGVANTIAVQLSPIIMALGNDFADAAKSSHGFRDDIIAGLEKISKAAAFAANTFRFFTEVFQLIKQIFAEVAYFIIDGIYKISDQFAKLTNALVDNKVGKTLGFSPVEVNQTLQLVHDVAKDQITAIRKESDALLKKPYPGDAIEAWFTNVKKNAQAAATEYAAAHQKMLDENAGFHVAVNKQEETAQKLFLKQLLEKSNAVRKSLMTDSERQKEAFDEQRATLTMARANDLISEATYQDEMKRIDEKAEDEKHGIKERFRELDRNSANFFFGQLSQLMQSHNKKQFEIGKMASIAQTAISTAEAAQKAYTAMSGIPYVGPFLGAAAAAAAIAFGIGQINQIRSTQFEGGGAPSGGAVPSFSASPSTGLPTGTPGGDVGPTPSPTAAAAAPPPRNVDIYVQNDTGVMSTAWARDQLMPLINEAIGDGVTLNLHL